MRTTLIESIKNNVQSILIPMLGARTGNVKPQIVAKMMYKAYIQIKNPSNKMDWDYLEKNDMFSDDDFLEINNKEGKKMSKREEFNEVKRISDEIIRNIIKYNSTINKYNKNIVKVNKIWEKDNLDDKRKYNENVDKYNEQNKKYKKNKLKRLLMMYNYTTPPIANFDDDDFVINLMGINPNTMDSVDQENIYIKDKNKYIKTGLEYLNLCYVPSIDKKEVRKILSDNLNDVGKKGEPYICSNTNYIDKQYYFWLDINNEHTEYVKMHWQKFNNDFIDEIYYENKNIEKYKKIINMLNSKINKTDFSNKYFIFTDLFYVPYPNQDELNDFIDENEEKICELFNKQLEYYHSKLTIVANSRASKFVKEKILKDVKNGWQQVEVETDMEKYSNIYRKKIVKKGKSKNIYIYLANRYWDRKDIAFKNLIKKDVNRFLKHIEEFDKI